MKILTIETSGKLCGVSILEDNNLIDMIELNNGLTHSETLMPIINDIFEKNNLQLSNINLIVCDIGPGSFTGLRIGVATAKAFSDSIKIKTIGVSSLTALAYNVKKIGYVCSIIDAKNDNCYYALYLVENNKYLELIQPTADTIYNVLKKLENYNQEITFVGDGAIIYKDTILNYRGSNSQFSDDNNIHSYNLGLVGINEFNTNKSNNDLLPLYLKKPQAERQLEEKLRLAKKDSDYNV